MKRSLRRAAICVLFLVGLAALFAPAIAPYDYSRQFREAPNAPASRRFPIGTDELGRDRFSRLLYATRVSAPAGSRRRTGFDSDRAVNIRCSRYPNAMGRTRSFRFHNALSVAAVDFSLHHSPRRPAVEYEAGRVYSDNLWPDGNRGLGVAGANFHRIDTADEAIGLASAGARIGYISLANRAGTRMAASARVIAIAQFRVLIPAYILSEASLGLLGLGVAEPLPFVGQPPLPSSSTRAEFTIIRGYWHPLLC